MLVPSPAVAGALSVDACGGSWPRLVRARVSFYWLSCSTRDSPTV